MGKKIKGKWSPRTCQTAEHGVARNYFTRKLKWKYSSSNGSIQFKIISIDLCRKKPFRKKSEYSVKRKGKELFWFNGTVDRAATNRAPWTVAIKKKRNCYFPIHSEKFVQLIISVQTRFGSFVWSHGQLTSTYNCK